MTNSSKVKDRNHSNCENIKHTKNFILTTKFTCNDRRSW